jgi:hypothetical protein
MITFVTSNNRKGLILFVHGFTGGQDTWKHPNYDAFYELLSQDAYMAEHYDIAYFEYYTKLLNIIATTHGMFSRFSSLFSKSLAKTQKNNSVSEIAQLLETELRFRVQAYDRIVVIAHSMGGLVTKTCIVNDLKGRNTGKIKLLISLAVPHLGADLATFGKLLSGNSQIKDLAPTGDLCVTINNDWVKLEKKPDIKYFYGTNDSVVSKNSACGMDSVDQDVIACHEDHLTICKPAGYQSTVYLAAVDIIKNLDSALLDSEEIDYQDLETDGQFQDELFVLKLMLADVHDSTVKNAKYHFLNAEYVRKYLRSDSDQRKLFAL